MMRKILFILALLLFTPPVFADDVVEYVKPDWANLIGTMIGFGAIDFTGDMNLVDEYVMFTHCDWYKSAFHDDFKWHEIRTGTLAALQEETKHYATAYYYDASLALDRYDFNDKIFRFSDKAGVHNVNAFLMSTGSTSAFICGHTKITHLPREFRAVLSRPVNVPGLPMEPKDGQELLHQMDILKNTNRIIYARFNLRIVYILPLYKNIRPTRNGDIIFYTQGKLPADPVQLDAQLDSVQFFEDPGMTLLVSTYKPPTSDMANP